jgi:hypothetical protein
VFLIDVGVHQSESWSFAPDQLPANCIRGPKPLASRFIHNDNGNLEDCCNIQRSGTANNSRPIRLQNWEFDHRKYVSFVCHDSSYSEFASVQEKTQVFSSVGLTAIPLCGMSGFGVGMSKSARACAMQKYESAHGSLAPLYKRAAALGMIRAEPTWTVNGSTGTYVQDSRVLTAWSTSSGHPSQTYIRGTRKREAATSMLV